jgi:hypothetical protein
MITMAKLIYFAKVKTKQECKKLFRELAKLNHPDNGGNNETMVSIIAEYEKLMKTLPTEKPNTDNNEQTEEQFNTHVSQEMQNIIDNISHLPIDIEVIGSWIWVSGDTYKYKSYLTAYNFVWCPQKKMYQWHMDRVKKYKTKVFGIDEIRTTYGTTKVNNSFRPVLV